MPTWRVGLLCMRHSIDSFIILIYERSYISLHLVRYINSIFNTTSEQNRSKNINKHETNKQEAQGAWRWNLFQFFFFINHSYLQGIIDAFSLFIPFLLNSIGQKPPKKHETQEAWRWILLLKYSKCCSKRVCHQSKQIVNKGSEVHVLQLNYPMEVTDIDLAFWHLTCSCKQKRLLI